MENLAQRGAILAPTSDERAGASHIRRLGALLVIVLLTADLLTRQLGLLAKPASEAVSGTGTTTFFKVQVGGFRAEIQWNSIGKPE
jgi:hypothetical protein